MKNIAEAQSAASIPPKPVRYAGIDIVKIVAAFLVVCIHFFLYSGFYQEPVSEAGDMVPIFFRWFSYCCVPLFMIVTGYLMKNKTVSKKYYTGIIKIIVIYLIISVVCAIYDVHRFGKVFTPWSFIKGMFMFTNAQYSWYVEYYICLFAFIPFINSAFNSLKCQKHKALLVATTIIFTVVGQSFFLGAESTDQIQVLPTYFERCYPIAYYLIGAYIREFPPARTVKNKLLALSGLLASLIWATVETYIHSIDNVDGNYVFRSLHYNDYGSWPMFAASTFIFLLLFDITVKNKYVALVLRLIGESTLGCYLISYVFDSHFYQKHSGKFPEIADRMSHFYEPIAKVFLCSMSFALILHGIYNVCDSLVRMIIRKRKASKAEALAEPDENEEITETEKEPVAVSQEAE